MIRSSRIYVDHDAREQRILRKLLLSLCSTFEELRSSTFKGFRGTLLVFVGNFCTMHLGFSEERDENIRGTPVDIFKRIAVSHCDIAQNIFLVSDPFEHWSLTYKPLTIIAFNQTEHFAWRLRMQRLTNKSWQNKCWLRNTNWFSASTLRSYACAFFSPRLWIGFIPFDWSNGQCKTIDRRALVKYTCAAYNIGCVVFV